jgi:tetratricopeptide (TPR) repeat protein
MEPIQNNNDFISQDKNKSPMSIEKVGYLLFASVIFLIPLFFIPSRFFLLDVSKTMILSLGVVASLLIFMLKIVKQGHVELPKHKLFLAALLVPSVFLVSAILGTNYKASLFGYVLEPGTWAFVTMGFVLMFLASTIFNSRKRIFYFYLAFLSGVILVAIVAIVKILFGGNLLSFGVMNGVVANSVGSWMDLAVFLAVAVMVSIMAIEMAPLDKLHKSILFGITALSLFVLAALNFSTVWLLLLIFSLAFFVYVASSQIVETSSGKERRLSYPGLILLVISLLFFFNPVLAGDNRLGDIVSRSLGVSNVEIRPSLLATREVVTKTFGNNFLLGSGPNTFDTQWLMNKPEGVNSSDFWNVSFTSGFSLLLTFVVTTGLLGTLAWIIFFVFYFKLGIQVMFSVVQDKLMKFLMTTSFVASLFLWVMALVYVPGATIFALAFVFTGLAVASGISAGVVGTRMINFGHSAKLSFLAIILLIGLVVGNVVFAYNAVSRSVSLAYFQKALVSANEGGDVDSAVSYLNKAIGLANHDVYHRALSQAYVVKINQSLNNSELTEDERVAIFQESLRSAIISAQNATNSNPGHYLNWLSLGNIYESLVAEPFNLEGSYESAKSSYSEALVRNPNSPEIYLVLARLEVLNGNIDEARVYIDQALSKKDNYANAYFLLTQIELSENNLEGAVGSAERAAMLSPNNPGVFFQLGLLKYNQLDYVGASEALAYAIRISPEYANAKYFLGLSLEKLGRQDEAIAQFEDLSVTNPDNEEVSIILENLRSGQDPFFQLPANVSDVSTRPGPPITEGE